MVLIQNYGWNGQAVWMYEAILYIAATYMFNCVSLVIIVTIL